MRQTIRVILGVLALPCFVVFAAQLVVYASGMITPGGWELGFARETWHTPGNVGHHRNWGSVMSARAWYFFAENEQHPVSPGGGTWWPRESSRLDPAGSPPQFTVFRTRRVQDRTAFGTGYRYSVRAEPDWQGQYHLVLVHPLLTMAVCGMVTFLAGRRAARRLFRRRRAAAGTCPACGYDLRAGHERCPACGTPVGVTPGAAPPPATSPSGPPPRPTSSGSPGSS